MSSGLGISLTLLAWWVGTGAVFLAARGSARRRRWAFLLATGGLGGVLTLLPTVSQLEGISGVLAALFAGFGAWAWVELSFYSGYVTGPSRRLPPEGASLGVRFRHALAACLWHELAIPVLGVGIWLLSPGGNGWALWIYLTFWALHEVARINVLVGVPHPFAELLPPHLAHLKPYLEPRPWGWPLVVTLAGHVAAGAALVSGAMGAAGTGEMLGWTALAALVALGWVEHLVLMFPIPLQRLWSAVGMARLPEPELVPDP